MDKAFVLRDDYVDKARVYMNAEVKSLDFAGNFAKGVSEINNWVEQKTDGKISNIFEPGNKIMIILIIIYYRTACLLN